MNTSVDVDALTDEEIASIFWRDTTKGTSDPFCWSGVTMMCYQVLASVFVKGYRAALAAARQAPTGADVKGGA